jgi:sulfotransferase family protein
MARPVKPEPKFFLVDDVYARGLEYYSRTWFASARADQMAGEKTTNYLEHAPAAERIARAIPQVKLVFVLREPASRAYSNYLWTTMNGLETEDFDAALRLEAQRERNLPDRLKYARPYAYFSRGLYLDLLQPYLDRFPRERILLLRYEQIQAAPGEVAGRLHRFLGVDARPDDAADLGVVNASERHAGGTALDATVRRLRARYAEPNRRLAAVFGPEFAWDA